MRHVNYTLKPVTIDNAKPREKAYSLTDGGGLIIEILPSGTKAWRFKYHLDGKREKVTLGNYPALSLKQAREKHEQMRLQVDQGVSPAKGKQALYGSPKLLRLLRCPSEPSALAGSTKRCSTDRRPTVRRSTAGSTPS